MGLGEKVKGLRSTSLWLQNRPRDVKYSVGDTVNHIVMTTYGARWVLEMLGEDSVSYISV